MAEKSELEKIASSWFSRTVKAASTSAGILGSLAAQGAKSLFAGDEKKQEIKDNSQIAIAIRLATQLGNLKGALMKLGQMASYIETVIPDEVREVLTALQDNTTPMKSSLVKEVIEQELGQAPEQIFTEFDYVPIAAASIGQVHRAQLQGKKLVAVKVQYPGIEKAFESDLKNASLLGQISKLILRGMDIDQVVDELRERLLEECNYEIEAQNQIDFAKLHRGEKNVIIPKVYLDHSSRRVLTTEFIDGVRFNEHISQADQKERNRIGRILFEMIMGSIFQHAVFNGDPHPGNYLIKSKDVAFLDFGCVKRWPTEFINEWKALVRAGYADDLQAFTDHFTKLGFVSNVNKFDYAAQFELNKMIWSPFLYDRTFEFNKDFTKALSDKMVSNNKNISFTSMPRDFVLINRLQWGMFSILADMRAEFNAYKIIHKLVHS